MNNITEITRRDIIDLFRYGYIEEDFIERKKVFYTYYGRLSEIEFLAKLYPLENMPSLNGRFRNVRQDIYQHTINNNDWNFDWFFDDNRFDLLRRSDLDFLNFLCAVFHPENRNENGCWKEYLEKINYIIKVDGYELYESGKISGRTIYSWRRLTSEESASDSFLPFLIRHKKELDAKILKLPSIPKKVRRELLELFKRYDEIQDKTTETNCNYSIGTIDALIKEDIKEYYIPKAFDPTGKYCETTNFEQFIMSNYPACVFDAIELYAQYNRNNNFADEVNSILQNNGFIYKLLGGKIETTQMNVQTKEVIREKGLKELVDQASELYNNGNVSNKQFAVEKLWDAFERLKTYYPDLKKNDSADKIINNISNNNDNYRELFADEFRKLTNIGNNFRIRHHEMDKIDITGNNYYDYFFQRCFALIDLALKYLK